MKTEDMLEFLENNDFMLLFKEDITSYTKTIEKFYTFYSRKTGIFVIMTTYYGECSGTFFFQHATKFSDFNMYSSGKMNWGGEGEFIDVYKDGKIHLCSDVLDMGPEPKSDDMDWDDYVTETRRRADKYSEYCTKHGYKKVWVGYTPLNQLQHMLFSRGEFLCQWVESDTPTIQIYLDACSGNEKEWDEEGSIGYNRICKIPDDIKKLMMIGEPISRKKYKG